MRLTEDSQFNELSRRCDLAMKAATAHNAIEIMGDYLNVNIPALPEPLRTKFSRVLDNLAERSVLGP